jgi:hypothetical protein
VGPKVNDHQRAPRGKVTGWSAGATRRNTRFLYSVEDDGLTGVGLAVTLTVRDCPPSAREWHALRRAWIKRMQRAHMIRLHWVTEWQRRGVPHLHAAIYFDELPELAGVLAVRARRAWAGSGWRSEPDGVAVPFGAGEFAQHVEPITDAVGWRQYVSKHASRGVSNYQRAAAGIPDGWRGETGRVWGTCGEWPVRDAVRINLQGSEGDGGWFAFRRVVRGWRRADARAEPVAAKRPGRIRAARAMLKASERGLSEVRGLSEWAGRGPQDDFLAAVAGMGYSVTC